jgi:alpha-methylacyl-CoA racemase
VPGFLEGIRVIDLSAVGPSSRASGLLGDYGAEIVKVLRPTARRHESFEPPSSAYGGGRTTLHLRVALDHAAGRELFLRLVESSDVVLESYRPGVADRLGIGPAAVHARNPRVIYCATSGYGQTGPYATWAGHDLNYVGVAGLLAQTERRSGDDPPVLGATIADAAGGGMHAVVAILAALLARERTGRGTVLDVSATDGVLWLMSLLVDAHLEGGIHAGPMSLLGGRYACYRPYRAGDGLWLTVAALEPRFWRNLCLEVGLPELVELQHDEDRQPEIIATLSATFATRHRDEWVARLAPADTCVSQVLTIEMLPSDPNLDARSTFLDTVQRDGTRRRSLAPLLAGMDRRPPDSAPRAGAEADMTLGALGFDDAEIATLLAEGVVE